MITDYFEVGKVYDWVELSTKNGKQYKRQLVLKEFGEKYGDSFIVTEFSAITEDTLSIKEGDLVIARIQATIHEYNGMIYQDIWLRWMLQTNWR